MPLLPRPCGAIRYEVSGELRPPLLLSHGYAATSAMFAANLAAIVPRNKVVTWDLRGHGGSECPSDPGCYTTDAAILDMAAVLDHLGLERAILGGHSLGGYLSLAFALAHPERVAGLVLIGTGPGFRSDEARERWNRMAEATASRIAERGLAAVPAGFELHGGAHRAANGLILAARGLLTQHDSHVIDGLGTIAVPALVVVGADDAQFQGAADYMAAKIPLGRKVVIPGAGHAPNVAAPALFAAELRSFLDSIAEPDLPSAAAH